MAVNSAKSWWNVDFGQYRNDVCLVMASFSEKTWLTRFHIYDSTCIVNSKCRCACLVYDWTWTWPAQLLAMTMDLNNQVTMTFLEVSACIAEKRVWFTCITESKRLECEFRQCDYKWWRQSPDVRFSTKSDLWSFDSIFLSLACFPTRILGGQQNNRVYNQ